MAVISLQKLPLGFRFRPTDEEIINHYLKRKITGRINTDVEVIPEIDVCKCEPWDLPDKSLIKSDDSEWFFFAPKDRKYPNGHRSNRATDAGYWKATGKDRTIRSKHAALVKANIVGMKKTLVFHKGRAPKGVRTNWIMHEYRTTEPEFESGEQGGYVLYKLFRKSEESLSTNAEETEASGFSPTATKSSPSYNPHRDADAVEEFGVPVNPESLKSELQEESHILPSVQKQTADIERLMTDTDDYSLAYPVKLEESCWNSIQNDHEVKPKEKSEVLEGLLAQFCDVDYEQIKSDGFPNISSRMLPCTTSFFVNNNQESRIGSFPVDNTGRNTPNDLTYSVRNPDECSSGASIIQKDKGLLESALSNDLEIEAGLMQGYTGADSSDWFYDSTLLPLQSFQMGNADGCPVIKPQLNAIYENSSLLPYDSMKTDAFSVDSGATSSQYLFNSMEDCSSNLKIDSKCIVEGTGITIRNRPTVNPPVLDYTYLQEGDAARRVLLQSSIDRLPFSGESEGSKVDPEKKKLTESCPLLSENIETPAFVDDMISRTESPEEPEMETKDQSSQSFLHTSIMCLQLESCSNSESSIGENISEVGENEVQEHLDDIAGNSDEVLEPALGDKHHDLSSNSDEVLGPAFGDKHHDLSFNGETCSSNSHQVESALRMRPRFQKDFENIQWLPSQAKMMRSHSRAGYTIWVFSVFILLLTLGCGLCIIYCTV